MLSSLTRTDTPASLVTLPEAKKHVRFTRASSDDEIEAMVAMATEQVEEITGRQFMKATYEFRLPRFPSGAIRLPKPPCLSVTSVEYLDTDGVLQTASSSTLYLVDVTGMYGRVFLRDGECWPDTQGVPGQREVIVTFVAGYSSSASVDTQRAAVPRRARGATLMHLSHLFDTARGIALPGTTAGEIPNGVKSYTRSLWVPELVEG